MPDHPSRRAATVLVAAIAAALLLPRPGIAADPAEDAAPAPSPVTVASAVAPNTATPPRLVSSAAFSKARMRAMVRYRASRRSAEEAFTRTGLAGKNSAGLVLVADAVV